MTKPGIRITARRRATRAGRSRQAALGEVSGFSILELVIVVVVIGLLSAAALARFIDRIGDAHSAAVTGTSSAFRSGVSLVHIKWIGEGSPGAVVDFLPISSRTGNGALSVNANGWPPTCEARVPR